jgi:hypothetical protein
VETTPDGFRYWARSPIPAWYYNIVCDLTATTSRYGKSVTAVKVGGVAITAGMSYPYPMPADAARLQTDLRAAGYTGALVTSSTGSLTLDITNHNYSNNNYNRDNLPFTLSGGNVTQVRTVNNAIIPLAYPYAMPAAAATLQADLRAAGQSGAVVRLYGDSWTVFLPNRPAANNLARQLQVDFDPGDPYPSWNMFGTYEGLMPDNFVTGTSGNVRPGVGGAQIPEANKQFGRMQVTPGPNYQYYGDTPP